MRRNAAVYACGHFLVDFTCALLMIGSITKPTLFLIYNFCAFALQMPIGLIGDILGRCKYLALAGITLVLCGCLPLSDAVRTVLLGLGNACYHVGGGRDALLADQKFTGLGIFVAPGALGIFLGTLLAGKTAYIWKAVIILAICAAALCTAGESKTSARTGSINWAGAGMMLLIVLIRSAVGMCMLSPWKMGVFVTASAVCCALGKALGGFAGDRFGWKESGVISLLCAAALYCLPGFGIAGAIATLVFNMTMPITLRKAADFLPGMEGFAFGVLTFALFLGYLPAYFGITISPYFGAALSAVSALLLGMCPEAEA